jgi:hypothetical protein
MKLVTTKELQSGCYYYFSKYGARYTGEHVRCCNINEIFILISTCGKSSLYLTVQCIYCRSFRELGYFKNNPIAKLINKVITI